MLVIAKIIAIYFFNIRNGAALDPKVLFIFITIFYAALLFISSDFFIQRVFNIQQGVLTIAKGLGNGIGKGNGKGKDLDNWNVDNKLDVQNNFNLNVEVNIYHFNYTVVKISSSFKHLNIKNDFINNLIKITL